MNRVLLSSPRYVSKDEFWFRRTLAEAEKLKSANRAEAHNVLAQLYGLAGDFDLAVQNIDAAIRLLPDVNYLCNKAVILSNLGFFYAASEPFKAALLPKHGLFTSRWTIGICLGAFHTLFAYVEQARRLQLKDLSQVDADLIACVVKFMDEISLTDEQLAQAFDVVGEITREYRLFFLGDGPEAFVWNDDPQERYLSFIFKFGVPQEEVLKLDEELGHRLFDRCGDLPAELMIHIESGLPANEHQPSRPAITS